MSPACGNVVTTFGTTAEDLGIPPRALAYAYCRRKVWGCGVDNPFITDILVPTIARECRNTRDRRVKTGTLHALTGVAYSTVQFYLTKAEAAGLIERVGLKSGWRLPNGPRVRQPELPFRWAA